MNGILNLNKPAGMTSHDCVGLVRRLTGIRRVGHTGTLDPNATGVLPICVGTATRVAEYLESQDKTYRCVLRLGLETDTQDIWGSVLSERPTEALTEDEIRSAIESFVGDIHQVPPKYSALKVAGRRLYEYARAGEDVEIKSRPVTIRNIDLHWISGREAEFTVTCTKGTYIRTLCHDIGQKLGCGGAMASLVRTATGGFRLEDSLTPEALALLSREELEARLIPADKPLEWMEKAELALPMARDFVNGKEIPFPGVSPGLVRVYLDREFLGVARADGTVLKAHKVFNVRLQNETV